MLSIVKASWSRRLIPGERAPPLLADAPDLMLAVAGDLLTWGDTARAGQYLDLLERAQPSICPESRLAARFAAMRSFRRFQLGQADQCCA